MREKRHYLRIPITFKVLYAVEDGMCRPETEALSGNISRSGVLIRTSSPLSVGAELSLQIVSPTHEDPILAAGRVTRVEEIEEGRLYESGIEFIRLTPSDADRIKGFSEIDELDKLLNEAVSKGASDLHLTADQPPIFRIDGDLVRKSSDVLSNERIHELVYGILSPLQREQFERELELDFSYGTSMGRFRVNVHREKGHIGAAFRHISPTISSFQQLGLPSILGDLALKPNGIILVTGPTGHGKSTTLAAMIDHINRARKCMIVSLEDPIEYVHAPVESTIKQREIGSDSLSFVSALKHTLRQDVDVILVGEMRDLDSISIALTAAETGHLVLTTLHTCSAATTINRIIDVFPAEQKQQIRTQLAETLRAVVSQVLLPRKDGKGRIVATEVMTCTPAIANTIRQGTCEQLFSFIETGSQHGMHTMDSSLEKLFRAGLISKATALSRARDPNHFPA